MKEMDKMEHFSAVQLNSATKWAFPVHIDQSGHYAKDLSGAIPHKMK